MPERRGLMERLKSAIRALQTRFQIVLTKDAIRKWQARAEMASQQGSDVIVQSALEAKGRQQKKLDELETKIDV